MGAPRVWYSVAGCHQSKFKAAMHRLIPEMSGEQLKMGHDPVSTYKHIKHQCNLLFSKLRKKIDRRVINNDSTCDLVLVQHKRS